MPERPLRGRYALKDPGYVRGSQQLPSDTAFRRCALDAHLVRKCVSDLIDDRHRLILRRTSGTTPTIYAGVGLSA